MGYTSLDALFKSQRLGVSSNRLQQEKVEKFPNTIPVEYDFARDCPGLPLFVHKWLIMNKFYDQKNYIILLRCKRCENILEHNLSYLIDKNGKAGFVRRSRIVEAVKAVDYEAIQKVE